MGRRIQSPRGNLAIKMLEKIYEKKEPSSQVISIWFSVTLIYRGVPFDLLECFVL